jgi:predicted transcriptional regulator
MEMKKRGAANTLLSKEMVEELGIDAAQKKRIEDRQKELKQELADRMAKLKEEIRDKLLSELTSDQKSKLEELSGDKFEYKPTSINDKIRKQIQKRMKSRIGG